MSSVSSSGSSDFSFNVSAIGGHYPVDSSEDELLMKVKAFDEESEESDELGFIIEELSEDGIFPVSEDSSEPKLLRNEWNIVRLLNNDRLLDFDSFTISDVEFSSGSEFEIQTLPNGNRKLFLIGTWKVKISNGDDEWTQKYHVSLPTAQTIGWRDKESGRTTSFVDLPKAKSEAMLKVKVQEQLFKRNILAAQDPGRYGPVLERERNVQRAAMRSLDALKDSGAFSIDLKSGIVKYEETKTDKKALKSKSPLPQTYKGKPLAIFQIQGEKMPGVNKTIAQIMKLHESELASIAKKTKVYEENIKVKSKEGPTIGSLQRRLDRGASLETIMGEAEEKLDQLFKEFDREAQYFTEPTDKGKKNYTPNIVRIATDHLYSNKDLCKNLAKDFEADQNEQKKFEELSAKDPEGLQPGERRFLTREREKRAKPNYTPNKAREDMQKVNDYKFAQELTVKRFEVLQRLVTELEQWQEFHGSLYETYFDEKLDELGDTDESREIIMNSEVGKKRAKIEKNFKTSVKFEQNQVGEVEMAKARLEQIFSTGITRDSLGDLKSAVFFFEEANKIASNYTDKRKEVLDGAPYITQMLKANAPAGTNPQDVINAYDNFHRWQDAAKDNYNKFYAEHVNLLDMIRNINEDHPNYEKIEQELDHVNRALTEIENGVRGYMDNYHLDHSRLEKGENFLTHALELFEVHSMNYKLQLNAPHDASFQGIINAYDNLRSWHDEIKDKYSSMNVKINELSDELEGMDGEDPNYDKINNEVHRLRDLKESFEDNVVNYMLAYHLDNSSLPKDENFLTHALELFEVHSMAHNLRLNAPADTDFLGTMEAFNNYLTWNEDVSRVYTETYDNWVDLNRRLDGLEEDDPEREILTVKARVMNGKLQMIQNEVILYMRNYHADISSLMRDENFMKNALEEFKVHLVEPKMDEIRTEVQSLTEEMNFKGLVESFQEKALNGELSIWFDENMERVNHQTDRLVALLVDMDRLNTKIHEWSNFVSPEEYRELFRTKFRGIGEECTATIQALEHQLDSLLTPMITDKVERETFINEKIEEKQRGETLEIGREAKEIGH